MPLLMRLVSTRCVYEALFYSIHISSSSYIHISHLSADAWTWVYGVIATTMSDAGDQYMKDIAAKITDVKASLTTEATVPASDSE